MKRNKVGNAEGQEENGWVFTLVFTKEEINNNIRKIYYKKTREKQVTKEKNTKTILTVTKNKDKEKISNLKPNKRRRNEKVRFVSILIKIFFSILSKIENFFLKNWNRLELENLRI